MLINGLNSNILVAAEINLLNRFDSIVALKKTTNTEYNALLNRKAYRRSVVAIIIQVKAVACKRFGKWNKKQLQTY